MERTRRYSVLTETIGTIIIGLLVPSNNEGLDLADGTAASSPFVIAIKNAGIRSLPSVHLCALAISF